MQWMRCCEGLRPCIELKPLNVQKRNALLKPENGLVLLLHKDLCRLHVNVPTFSQVYFPRESLLAGKACSNMLHLQYVVPEWEWKSVPNYSDRTEMQTHKYIITPLFPYLLKPCVKRSIPLVCTIISLSIEKMFLKIEQGSSSKNILPHMCPFNIFLNIRTRLIKKNSCFSNLLFFLIFHSYHKHFFVFCFCWGFL